MTGPEKSALSKAAAHVREAGRRLRGKSTQTAAPAETGVARVEAAAPHPMPSQKTIVDVGMHDGTDARYYRSRGFQVISFEANPELCDAFSRAIEKDGLDRIEIRNMAITDSDAEEIPFYVDDANSVWSSADPVLGARSGTAREIRVRAGSLARELEPVAGDIHYVKIDIEGFDEIALSQVFSLPVLPPYVSVENGNVEMMERMHAAGYEAFQFSNQRFVPMQRVPPHSQHGLPTPEPFPFGASGLFGNDLDGPWIGFEAAMKVQKGLRAAMREAPDNLFAETIGWFDLHASRVDTPVR